MEDLDFLPPRGPPRGRMAPSATFKKGATPPNGPKPERAPHWPKDRIRPEERVGRATGGWRSSGRAARALGEVSRIGTPKSYQVAPGRRRVSLPFTGRKGL